jgi:purine-binding chemotaxis protein CheW
LELVTFRVGQEDFCASIANVREIVRLPQITKMPGTPSYVAGVINLRGRVISVISIRERFKLEKADLTGKSLIIVMDGAEGSLIGYIVDSASEVIRVNSTDVEPPPGIAICGIGSRYVSGIIKFQDSMRICLDLDRLLSEEESKSISKKTSQA